MRVTLQSGRKIIVQQFLFRSSTLGVLEGQPEVIRRNILARAKNEAVRVFRGDPGFLLIEPAAGPLPQYQIFVELHSAPLKAGEDYSALICCWFDDKVPVGITDYVGGKIQNIAWEPHAKDWTC